MKTVDRDQLLNETDGVVQGARASVRTLVTERFQISLLNNQFVRTDIDEAEARALRLAGHDILTAIARFRDTLAEIYNTRHEGEPDGEDED